MDSAQHADAEVVRPDGFWKEDHATPALCDVVNFPTKAIQGHLGHSSFKITMDTYGHLNEDASDAVSNAMDAAFAAPKPELANVRAIRG